MLFGSKLFEPYIQIFIPGNNNDLYNHYNVMSKVKIDHYSEICMYVL